MLLFSCILLSLSLSLSLFDACLISYTISLPQNKTQLKRKQIDQKMDARHGRISVLMLPWIAHGHISPFLELAKKLTRRNFHIFFCSTPINLHPIKEKLPQKYSLSIQFVELHLPSLPELPPHYHTTDGLPPRLAPTLKKAFDMGSQNFSTILKSLSPDLLVYDFIQQWALSLALSQNIPAVEFSPTSAAMTSFLIHNIRHPGINFPFPETSLWDYEVAKFTQMLEYSVDSIKDVDRVLECYERSSDGIVLIKRFREIEGKYIDFLSNSTGKKIVPVGPVVEEPVHGDEKRKIIEWLNGKKRSSTVFVSFGSEYFLSEDEIEEMAHGLQLSMVRFIWVVRFPAGDKISLEMALPKGFLDEVILNYHYLWLNLGKNLLSWYFSVFAITFSKVYNVG